MSKCLEMLPQVSLSLMVNEPKPGDASYEAYMEEKGTSLASLRRRAHVMTDGFNNLEGVTCNFTEGAMYSFPRIRLPAKVHQGTSLSTLIAVNGSTALDFRCL